MTSIKTMIILEVTYHLLDQLCAPWHRAITRRAVVNLLMLEDRAEHPIRGGAHHATPDCVIRDPVVSFATAAETCSDRSH